MIPPVQFGAKTRLPRDLNNPLLGRRIEAKLAANARDLFSLLGENNIEADDAEMRGTPALVLGAPYLDDPVLLTGFQDVREGKELYRQMTAAADKALLKEVASFHLFGAKTVLAVLQRYVDKRAKMAKTLPEYKALKNFLADAKPAKSLDVRQLLESLSAGK